MVGAFTDAVGSDRAVRVIVSETVAEVVGAVLIDLLGPFEQATQAGGMAALTFYPEASGLSVPADASMIENLMAVALLDLTTSGLVRVETDEVPRDWVEGWRDHFVPITIGRVRIRPPWELALDEKALIFADGTCVDVVINPGLGFGTGLHPTTRGTLRLLQEGSASPSGLLVDVGTGSGVLAVAAAKLGWTRVIALDNDPVALASARQNIEANRVSDAVAIHEVDVVGAPPEWFVGATVLANMTLEPVTVLLRKLGGVAERPRRLVISGILAGAQERELLRTSQRLGFMPTQHLYEDEWVSLELRPELFERGSADLAGNDSTSLASEG